MGVRLPRRDTEAPGETSGGAWIAVKAWVAKHALGPKIVIAIDVLPNPDLKQWDGPWLGTSTGKARQGLLDGIIIRSTPMLCIYP